MKISTLTLLSLFLVDSTSFAAEQKPIVSYRSSNGGLGTPLQYRKRFRCEIGAKTVIKESSLAGGDGPRSEDPIAWVGVKDSKELMDLVKAAAKARAVDYKHPAPRGGRLQSYSAYRGKKEYTLLYKVGPVIKTENTSPEARKLISFIDATCAHRE